MRALLRLAVPAAAALLACHDDPRRAEGEACGSGAECRSGLCFRRACASGLPPSSTCTPPGAPALVLGAPIAAPDPGAGVCATTVRDPVPAAEYLDLGENAVGTKLSFDVPAGTSTLTLLMQEVPGTAVPFVQFHGSPFPNGVAPTDVLGPDGALVYSDTDPPPQAGLYADASRLLAFAALSPVTGAFTIPTTSAALDLALTAGELPRGTWTFTVNDYAYECLTHPRLCSGGSASGRYRVHVLAKPRPFASTGSLDVEVYLATDGVTSQLPGAAAAAADPRFARWVNSLGAYFARAGLCLGTVTVHDLPAWAKARYAPGGIVDVSGAGLGLPPSQTPPGCDDPSQLFTLALAQRRAVHLFFADALVDRTISGDFTILGQDGTIPGPSGLPGTVSSGAVVGIFDLLGAEASRGACAAGGDPSPAACGTDWLAFVSAHEAGHWLGLVHTTEAEGVSFDLLADTPTCACLSCAPEALRGSCLELQRSPAPTFMSNAWCTGIRPRCGGGQNLMFWLFDPGLSTGELTREQGEVMRLNSAVR